MKEQPYHKLLAWRAAHEFVVAIYRKTESFPRQEMYSLTSQLRRAALSMPANIVEGQAKRSVKDFCRFLNIAEGSSKECAYYLELANTLTILNEADFRVLEDLRTKADIFIHRLRESFPFN